MTATPSSSGSRSPFPVDDSDADEAEWAGGEETNCSEAADCYNAPYRQPAPDSVDAAFATQVRALNGGRYEWEGPIGDGGFGTVARCRDKISGERVAVKWMEWRTQSGKDGTVLTDTRRIIREVQVLRAVRHPNIVKLVAAYGSPPAWPAATDAECESEPFDVFLVFELMDLPLSAVIKKHVDKIMVSGQGVLSCWHVTWLTFQLLHGLFALHSAGITHRDIKPHNLLVRDRDTTLQICDFGLARGARSRGAVSDYVQTRWYRCPELLWQQPTLDASMDIWSAGCVLAELLTGDVLFRFGSTRTDGLYDGRKAAQRLVYIIDIIGTPTTDEISRVQGATDDSTARVRSYFSQLTADHLPSRDTGRKVVDTLLGKSQVNGMLAPSHVQPAEAGQAAELAERQESLVKELVSLADRMLQFDRQKRPSAKELLQSHTFALFAEGDLEQCGYFDEQDPAAETDSQSELQEMLRALLSGPLSDEEVSPVLGSSSPPRTSSDGVQVGQGALAAGPCMSSDWLDEVGEDAGATGADWAHNPASPS